MRTILGYTLALGFAATGCVHGPRIRLTSEAPGAADDGELAMPAALLQGGEPLRSAARNCAVLFDDSAAARDRCRSWDRAFKSIEAASAATASAGQRAAAQLPEDYKDYAIVAGAVVSTLHDGVAGLDRWASCGDWAEAEEAVARARLQRLQRAARLVECAARVEKGLPSAPDCGPLSGPAEALRLRDLASAELSECALLQAVPLARPMSSVPASASR